MHKPEFDPSIGNKSVCKSFVKNPWWGLVRWCRLTAGAWSLGLTWGRRHLTRLDPHTFTMYIPSPAPRHKIKSPLWTHSWLRFLCLVPHQCHSLSCSYFTFKIEEQMSLHYFLLFVLAIWALLVCHVCFRVIAYMYKRTNHDFFLYRNFVKLINFEKCVIFTTVTLL